jgi:hypothetical protein
VRPGARQEMTGGEAPAPHLLSSPALPALFMPIASLMTGNFSSSHGAQENSGSFPTGPISLMLFCSRREKANYYLPRRHC